MDTYTLFKPKVFYVFHGSRILTFKINIILLLNTNLQEHIYYLFYYRVEEKVTGVHGTRSIKFSLFLFSNTFSRPEGEGVVALTAVVRQHNFYHQNKINKMNVFYLVNGFFNNNYEYNNNYGTYCLINM